MSKYYLYYKINRSTNDKMIHISDWLPTILNLAQTEFNEIQEIDGFDQVEAIFGDSPSPRTFMVNEFSSINF